jgi:hypothetical protein
MASELAAKASLCRLAAYAAARSVTRNSPEHTPLRENDSCLASARHVFSIVKQAHFSTEKGKNPRFPKQGNLSQKQASKHGPRKSCYDLGRGERICPSTSELLGSKRNDHRLKVFKPSKRKAALTRKVFTFLALVCFCIATVPLPIASIEIRDKDLSLPYPCQNSPCGCKSAEQCWRSCCCNTPAQRLAWAKKNGVTPPNYALAILHESATAQQPVQREATVGCCERSGSSVGLAAASLPDKLKTACCSPKPGFRSAPPSQPTKLVEPSTEKSSRGFQSRKIVLSVCALKCQGKSSEFTLLPWTILTTAQALAFSATEPGTPIRAADVHPSSIHLKPDTPPPRQCLS